MNGRNSRRRPGRRGRRRSRGGRPPMPGGGGTYAPDEMSGGVVGQDAMGPMDGNPNENGQMGPGGDYGGGHVGLPPTEPMAQEGLLEIMQDGFGFLRFHQNNYLPDEDDIYV